jgi:hypothetical protein
MPDDKPEMVKCPCCDDWLPEEDFDRQRVHLLANHPGLVAQRTHEQQQWGNEDQG